MGKDVMIKLNHVQKKYPDFSMDCSLTVYPGLITGYTVREQSIEKSGYFDGLLSDSISWNDYGTDRSEWRRKKYDI